MSSPTACNGRIGDFDEEMLPDIELDENQCRLDLSEYEASVAKLRQIEDAERDAAEEGVSARDARKPNGRPRRGDSETARRTGIKRDEVRRTKKHVAAAKKVPPFKGQGWKRSQVLAADEAPHELPKADQVAIVALIEEHKADPTSAVKIVEKMACKPALERKPMLTEVRGDPVRLMDGERLREQ